MRKRVLSLCLALMMGLAITACSDNGKQVESKKTVAEATTTKAEESSTVAESQVGEIVEENGIKKVPIVTDKALNLAGETGPFKYSINQLQVSQLTATTDEMAEMLDVEKGKEIALLVLNITAENTSDDNLSFYIGQATITTDTKEQVQADMVLSDNIDGEFLGNVKHSGNLMFILKESNADDISKVKFFVDAPTDENFDTVGDNVELELNIK